MKSLIILISVIVAIVLTQNITNEKYHLYYHPYFFNGFGLQANDTNVFDRAVWAEIMNRTNISAYISPTYSLNNDLYLDFYQHVGNCDMDGFTTSTFIYPSLVESLGVLPTISIAPILHEDLIYWTTFTNLPRKADVHSGSCYFQSNCYNNSFCSNYTKEMIVEFAQQNNNVTIYIYYYPNSFFYDYALLMKQQYENLSYSNVELVNYTQGYDNYLEVLKNISTQDPTQSIHIALNPYIDDEYCAYLHNNSSPFNLSITYTYDLPLYPLAYVFCPNKTDLFEVVNNTLKEMYDENFICGLQIDILDYCYYPGHVDPNDRCQFHPNARPCESGRKRSGKRSIEPKEHPMKLSRKF